MKNRITLAFLVINLIVISCLLFVVYHKLGFEKKAYVLNHQIFEEFHGTYQLKEELKRMRNEHKVHLDSLAVAIEQENPGLISKYEQLRQQFALSENELSDKYTADIWKEINRYISDYGKENGYDFIFGASGSGNLMFAKDAHNVTEDIIEYVNRRYEGK